MASRNPITMESLETLDAIERRGSFAKAAEELNKATSAVSYTVQKLEEQLDISLFQRQGRRSVLTPAGRLILVEGREILNTSARLASAAKEVATGWEARICIATESVLPYEPFFTVLKDFTEQCPSIEVDLQECVLNGGWELLDGGVVDLVVGVPGPVPQHKGYRSLMIPGCLLVPVIAANHPLAKLTADRQAITTALSELTRVITHDSSRQGVKRSEGLSSEGKHFYVQTIDQKIHAIMAGIGIGHLPYARIHHHLKSGELVALNVEAQSPNEGFIVWKINNKGKGLRALIDKLAEIKWQG